MLDWVRKELLEDRLISPGDVDLLSVTDDVDEVVEIVVDCYERRCAQAGAPVL
jgi:predicted Rossmann-fold nucleotide-binding protein